jgi:GTP cyclohydrolase I
MQSSRDHRQLAIQQVGVKGLRYPLTLLDAAGEAHPTVATLAMTVGLPPEVKGTHMSRFVEILERPRDALGLGRPAPHAAGNPAAPAGQCRSHRDEVSLFHPQAGAGIGVASLLDLDAAHHGVARRGRRGRNRTRGHRRGRPACAPAPRKSPITARTTSART